MSSKRKSKTTTEELPVYPSFEFKYPANARQFEKRPSPLAASMVAPGYVYEMSTGLVKPATTTPTPEEETDV
ncbi:hypothetical protein SynBIOSU31_00749 [Synechococcus sp. BIOS-U3-1]|uniref:hypothetical protein n=1 Tax=Synechococcus sp. BIOS-U3-1 TaxID=1400865 RepID=UPI00164550CA|nr:hypothetical protein [Synechococcus sp. BIOS-U3-1]QNI57641.1 hypothetical protein SynBIOSU31_00749 [Synechococcus sp. BIOS-U3-1]